MTKFLERVFSTLMLAVVALVLFGTSAAAQTDVLEELYKDDSVIVIDGSETPAEQEAMWEEWLTNCCVILHI